MKHILKYIFSICLLFSVFLAQAQDTTVTKEIIQEKTKSETKKPIVKEVLKDSIPKTDRYGLRVGVDLYKLTRGLYDKDYKGIEFTADWRLTKKYYIAAELGYEDKTTDDDRLNSSASGTYIKAGFDYNFYQNWLDMENMIFIGMRYGVASFSQNLNSYRIYDTSSYFEEVIVPADQQFSGLSAHWVEVVGGVKAELFSNFFLGFTVRLKNLVANKKPDNFDNLYIPGFNRTYDGNFGVGFNYTLSYFIPLYKKEK
mgnify:CR=1 FL=1